jgi:hypothetical protein
VYVKLEEVVYIHPSKYRPQVGDSVAYERELAGNRVFTITGEPSKHDGKPIKVAGVMFENTNGHMCLVPTVWDEHDAFCARTFEPPACFPEAGNPAEDELAYWMEKLGFSYTKKMVVYKGEWFKAAHVVEAHRQAYRVVDGAVHVLTEDGDYHPDEKMTVVAGPVASEAELPEIPFSIAGWFTSPVNICTDGQWYQIGGAEAVRNA